MSEREPPSHRPEGEQPAWDLAGIAQALNAPPEPERVDDIAFGAGHRFRFGGEQATRLEVYPAASVVRLTGRNAQISLFRQAAPEISQAGVVFEQPGCFLSVATDGSLTLLIAPQTPPPARPQSPPTPVSGSESVVLPPGESKPTGEPSGSSRGMSPDRSRTGMAPAQEAEHKQRVTL